jgi:uncharacterized coiled-coil protein SlyX
MLAGSSATAADADLEARIRQLENLVSNQGTEIQQLRSTSGESWMTQRRAEEVRALIGDVLKDADTRASLASHGMTAGHNGGFFISSEDGNFLLNVGGMVQARYIYNDANDPDRAADEYEDERVSGFQLRRARVRFDGHVVDPRLTYAIQFSNMFGQDNNDDNLHGPGSDDEGNSYLFLEEASFGYEFADGLQVVGGQLKGPFLREEGVNASHQLAVERSWTADYFTIDYTQGVGINWTGDLMNTPARASMMIHDGSYSAGQDYAGENYEFAVAGRAELLLSGSWDQFDDFTSSSSGDFGLMVGAAVDWETPTVGDDSHNDDEQYDILKWTADVSIEAPEMSGLNIFVAAIGQHITDAAGDSDSDTPAHQIGFLGQAGVYLVPDQLELFARYEMIDLDGVYYYTQQEDGNEKFLSSIGDGDDDLSILTLGVNYYFSDHAAKLTLDSVWSLNDLPISDTGAGLTENDDNDQWALRAQFQLMF